MPLILLLLACVRSEDPESLEIDDFEEGIDLLDDSKPIELAMKNVGSVLQTDPSPFGNSQQEATVTVWLKVRWERSGTDVTWTETVCDMAGNEVFGTTTEYPNAFQEAVGVKTRTGTLSTEATGAELVAGPFVDVLGADLADPEDPLPEQPGDETVSDDDDDGEPGVTVHVVQNTLGEGDVYVAQRLTQTFTGTAVAADRIEGFVELEREQTVLGATAGWLEIPVEEEPDPDGSHSFFILQGIPTGTTCGEILDDREELFQGR